MLVVLAQAALGQREVHTVSGKEAHGARPWVLASLKSSLVRLDRHALHDYSGYRVRVGYMPVYTSRSRW